VEKVVTTILIMKVAGDAEENMVILMIPITKVAGDAERKKVVMMITTIAARRK